MNIDFNNVRRQAIAAYSGLVSILKAKTDDGDRIDVHLYEIQNDMENLRSALVGIALAYVEGDDEFQDVLGEERVPSICDEDEDV